jgi:hypothetical protein
MMCQLPQKHNFVISASAQNTPNLEHVVIYVSHFIAEEATLEIQQFPKVKSKWVKTRDLNLGPSDLKTVFSHLPQYNCLLLAGGRVPIPSKVIFQPSSSLNAGRLYTPGFSECGRLIIKLS